MDHRWKVYVAGPEGLLIEGPEIEVWKERLCGNYDLECLRSDKSGKGCAAGGPDFGTAYAKCAALMLRADFGVFNLTPVAGSAPDADTIFRLGMITALGKPAYAYVNQDLAPLERSASLNGMLENSIVGSYFAMHSRPIVFKAVPAKNQFSNLAGFEECLRAAKQDLLQSSEDSMASTGFV